MINITRGERLPAARLGARTLLIRAMHVIIALNLDYYERQGGCVQSMPPLYPLSLQEEQAAVPHLGERERHSGCRGRAHARARSRRAQAHGRRGMGLPLGASKLSTAKRWLPASLGCGGRVPSRP